MERDGSGRDLL